jgi:nitrite reductase/ring-hydroxylating ferredoxin subunit
VLTTSRSAGWWGYSWQTLPSASSTPTLRDECTHEDYPLSDGELDDFTVECPRHGSRFDIRTGDVLNPPAVVPVETYLVEILDGDVAVWVRP